MTTKYYILADARGEFLRTNSTPSNWFSAESQDTALYVEATTYSAAQSAFAELGFEGDEYTIVHQNDAFTFPKMIAAYGEETLLSDLPDRDVDDSGSPIALALKGAGYDQSARATINEMRAWGKSVGQLAEILEGSK